MNWYEIWWGVYPRPWSYKGPNRKEFKSDADAIAAAKEAFQPEDKGWRVVKCIVIHEAV